ncbi:uncharacterized protein RJT21DRAFT_122448 [Scheffersomyces amazonensis]|uniref:uncharacterized protein n=1 Tax=Scheffersomyces amazonensis TaxID=1078765 RepID=UPI00315DD001
MAANHLVLVTGGTGFVATFTIFQLLQRGYSVRTTVRNLDRSKELNKDLVALNKYDHVKGKEDTGKTFQLVTPELLESNLVYYSADLSKDSGWDEAINGVDFILHIASPIGEHDSTEDEMVKPAVEGTLRILNLSLKYHVKRVVVMSSCAAVKYDGRKPDPVTGVPPLANEKCFSTPKDVPNAYSKSKLMQEFAVWDWVKSEKNVNSSHPVEVSVINPPAIYGPNIPGKVSLTAQAIIKSLVDGKMKFGVPRIYFSGVDVRDVAYITYRSMIEPFAKNQRYIVDSNDEEDYPFINLATAIRKHYAIPANNINNKVKISNLPTRVLPSWLLRTLALFVPLLKLVVPLLDKRTHTTNAKAVKAFNWTPISYVESVFASIDSLP